MGVTAGTAATIEAIEPAAMDDAAAVNAVTRDAMASVAAATTVTRRAATSATMREAKRALTDSVAVRPPAMPKATARRDAKSAGMVSDRRANRAKARVRRGSHGRRTYPWLRMSMYCRSPVQRFPQTTRRQTARKAAIVAVAGVVAVVVIVPISHWTKTVHRSRASMQRQHLKAPPLVWKVLQFLCAKHGRRVLRVSSANLANRGNLERHAKRESNAAMRYPPPMK